MLIEIMTFYEEEGSTTSQQTVQHTPWGWKTTDFLSCLEGSPRPFHADHTSITRVEKRRQLTHLGLQRKPVVHEFHASAESRAFMSKILTIPRVSDYVDKVRSVDSQQIGTASTGATPYRVYGQTL